MELNPVSTIYIAPSGPNIRWDSLSSPPAFDKDAGNPVLLIANVLIVLDLISILDILCPALA